MPLRLTNLELPVEEPEEQLRDLIAALDQGDREERLNEKQKLHATNFAKFKAIKPQAVSVS